MTIREFINKYRAELDRAINTRLNRDGTPQHYSVEECRQWVLNDESLYNWARSEGVRI